MSQVSALLAQIEAFCRDRQMAETTFGRLAVNDGKFVQRLRDGADVTVRTVERVRAFIDKARSPLADGDASARTDAQPEPESGLRRVAGGG